MRNITLIIVAAIIVLGGYLFLPNTKLGYAPSGSKQNTNPKSQVYCSPSDLNADITTQGAAGSIYGTLKITNNSGKTCLILGGQYITVTYDKSVKNISISYLGDLQKENFKLTPNQIIYSQVRFPNGPQCSSQTKQIPVIFAYKISPDKQLEFKSVSKVVVQACSSPNEDTEINIWNLSEAPISL